MNLPDFLRWKKDTKPCRKAPQFLASVVPLTCTIRSLFIWNTNLQEAQYFFSLFIELYLRPTLFVELLQNCLLYTIFILLDV